MLVAVKTPLPGALPVACPMPPVIVPAGNIADSKFKPLLAPDAVYTSGSVLSPFTNAMNWPAKAPFAGNVKFTLPPPAVYVATFRQLLPLCEYGQNFKTMVTPLLVPTDGHTPAPLLAEASTVVCPTATGVLLITQQMTVAR